MHYLLTLLSQIATFAAVAYVYLGQQWLTDNYGIHPMLSGAAALSLLLSPYVMAWSIHNRAAAEQDEQWATQAADDFDEAVDIVRSIRQSEQDKLDAANEWLRHSPVTRPPTSEPTFKE